MAAPSIPSAGIGPKPKINNGSRIIFSPFAIISIRIEIAASPALLKIAFMMNRSIITKFPPSIIRVYPLILEYMFSDAPINLRRSSAKIIPGIAINMETIIPVIID